jgi:uncharacterized protein (DUF488 family)
MNKLFTIGHSNHSTEKLIELLKRHAISALCDVRSSPYSKHNPQFNRENIQRDLKRHDILYVYLGRELGPRSDDPACYDDGKVQYHRLAKARIFQQGLERVRKGMQTYRLAMMCAEKDPIMCHRTILVCRHLRSKNMVIKHILEDGSIEDNSDSEKRLMRDLKIPQLQLFDSTEELIQSAYEIQGQKIAYIEPANDHQELKDGLENT